jgi:hypothetical protein
MRTNYKFRDYGVKNGIRMCCPHTGRIIPEVVTEEDKKICAKQRRENFHLSGTHLGPIGCYGEPLHNA